MTSSRAVLAVAAAAAAVLLVGCGSGGTPAATTSGTSASAPVSSVPASAGSGSASSSAPGSPGSSASGSAGGSTGAVPSAAVLEQYCEQSGGLVQSRSPYWNTNGDQSQWLALAGSATMCRFQADDEAKSRIYVDLNTLGSAEPTLAGLAYLSKVPMPPGGGGGNPATLYCGTELSASSAFGGGAAGGGWVDTTDPDDVVVALCVFPDGSYIDEWGLAYHSNGDVRGKDLTTVMKYQPSGALPPVFPTS